MPLRPREKYAFRGVMVALRKALSTPPPPPRRYFSSRYASADPYPAGHHSGRRRSGRHRPERRHS